MTGIGQVSKRTLKHFPLFLALVLFVSPVGAAILFHKDFEDEHLTARGFSDIAKWGETKSLSIAGPPEVKANTGQRCLKIRYAQGDTGGWMHRLFPGVREVYCHPIRVEHHKGTFDATRDWKAILSWESASIKREPIPATQFYPPDGFVEP